MTMLGDGMVSWSWLLGLLIVEKDLMQKRDATTVIRKCCERQYKDVVMIHHVTHDGSSDTPFNDMDTSRDPKYRDNVTYAWL